MKLIQEIRPFFALKVYIKVVFEKKIHPPRLLIFQKNSNLHGYSNLHVYWFCNFCTPSTFIPTSTLIREMRVLYDQYLLNII